MEIYETSEKAFSLRKAVAEKSVCPTGVLDATVYVHGAKLEIRFAQEIETAFCAEEEVLFFWDYAGARPLLVREVSLRAGAVWLEADKNLMLQMQYLQLSSVRAGIALRSGGRYFCGYFRNREAKNEELRPEERWIGRLAAFDGRAFIAYWTEGGILSLKFCEARKFDSCFYRAELCGYYWEAGKLVSYVELPLMAGEAEGSLYSLSTGERRQEAVVKLERAGETGLRSVWKMRVDLSGLPSGDSDGYEMRFAFGEHVFAAYFDDETVQDTPEKPALGAGGTPEACVIREEDGRFVLKTGKIYPVMLSIVTAVYNTAPFLAEMIHSVLSQDTERLRRERRKDYRRDYYGDILELILVDDGSTDGSGGILDDYAVLSDRIKVVHRENGGVSSARNAGIRLAQGKYLNFADSDDKLSAHFVEECLLFFEHHADEVDLVTAPLKFFDASSGEHWTNYKFQGGENRVLNLWEEPDAVTVSCCSTVFRRRDVEGHLFRTELVNGEDIVFLHEMLLRGQGKIGMIASAYYSYRRRSTGEASAIGQSTSDPRAYTDYLANVLERLLLESRTEGKIPRYIQYTVMGQLQWKCNTDDMGRAGKEALGEADYRRYKEKAVSLLQYIDDDIIISQRKIWSEHFYYLLQKKYGCPPRRVRENGDIYFEFQGTRIRTSLGECYVRLEFLSIEGNRLHLEGYSMNFMPEAELLICVDGENAVYQRPERDVNKYAFDEVIFYGKAFSLDIPLEERGGSFEIAFYSGLYGERVEKKRLRLAKTMPLAQSYQKSYYQKDGWAVRREGTRLKAYHILSPEGAGIDFEEEFRGEIEKSRERERLKQILALRHRALCALAGKGRKKIWLISDRTFAAGDNGEAFFRFLDGNPDPEVEPYFLIEESSPDYARMQSYGRVVACGSRQHQLLQLIADCIISSSADEYVINPWYESKAEAEVVRDFLAGPKFIFLQHGVIKDDLSEWLNRYNKNITGFVCAAPREAQSILDCPYHYGPENVWLTGLPRHDRLYREEKNDITIMPTWRKYLSANSGGTNDLVPDFEKSGYFRFYNGLINDERLLSAAERLGYRICFMPHPGVRRKGLSLFERDPRAVFFGFDTPYRRVYAESVLVVTDYSSAVMDFALLRKPVVYCQFDREEFYASHLYQKGYYDYERDGFGEVTYDRDALVEVLISYMEDKCRVREPYGSRMDAFFGFHDHENCRRVYEKIKALEGRGDRV